MDPVQSMSPAVRARLQQHLPDGYTLENLRFMPALATVTPDAPADDALKAVLASVVAAPAMVNSDGKPTIMKIVAWMVHGDVPNRNGDMFLSSDLQRIAPSLFKAPNLGVIDWNHSAIHQFGDEPLMIGVWYDAEFAWDPKANGGKGANGIRVTGTVFSWLFPQQANEMLADQERDGHVRFSMAAIPRSVEFKTINDTRASVLHDPIFFTNSALNKANADPDANGNVSENTEVTTEDLKQRLTPAHVTVANAFSIDNTGTWIYYPTTTTQLIPTITWPATPTWIPATISAPAFTVAESTEDKAMTISQEQFEKALADKVAAEAKAVAAEAKVADTLVKLAAAEAKVLALESFKAEAEPKLATLVEIEASLADVTTQRDAVKTELQAMQAKVVEIEAALAAVQAKLTEFESKAAEVAKAELLAARLAKLPEGFREALSKKDAEKRAKVTARIAEMSEEAFGEYLEDLLDLIPVKKAGFVARSAAEGTLIVATNEGLSARIAQLNRQR